MYEYIAEGISLLIYLFISSRLSSQAIRLSSNCYFTLSRCSVKNPTKKISYNPESNLGLSSHGHLWRVYYTEERCIIFSNVKKTDLNFKVYIRILSSIHLISTILI